MIIFDSTGFHFESSKDPDFQEWEGIGEAYICEYLYLDLCKLLKRLGFTKFIDPKELVERD